jgi:hypothetical protein
LLPTLPFAQQPGQSPVHNATQVVEGVSADGVAEAGWPTAQDLFNRPMMALMLGGATRRVGSPSGMAGQR